MSKTPIRYFVFDIESVADGNLVSKLRFPGQNLQPAEAIARYRAELLDKYDSDFIPYTFQIPVSIVVAKVSADLRIVDLVALDEPDGRPHVITELFWKGWDAYQRPTLVTFNGRTFDVPLLELAAFRYGIGPANWFESAGPSYEHPRNRYNTKAHLDLHDLLTNYGATRFNGGLNLAANLLGKPGKMDVQGDMVQDLYDSGQLVRINDYCRCDVLDTYFVFLRSCVLLGRISRQQEQDLVQQTKAWLLQRSEEMPGLKLYLEHWGDWQSPWESPAS